MVGLVGVLVWLVGWGGCLGSFGCFGLFVDLVGWLSRPLAWPGGMREAIKFAAACKADGRDSRQ